MCLFRLNGYVIVVFGTDRGGIAKELNVRLAMGSLLAICFVIRDLVREPAGLGVGHVPLLVTLGLKISIHPCKVRGLSSPMYM